MCLHFWQSTSWKRGFLNGSSTALITVSIRSRIGSQSREESVGDDVSLVRGELRTTMMSSTSPGYRVQMKSA